MHIMYLGNNLKTIKSNIKASSFQERRFLQTISYKREDENPPIRAIQPKGWERKATKPMFKENMVVLAVEVVSVSDLSGLYLNRGTGFFCYQYKIHILFSGNIRKKGGRKRNEKALFTTNVKDPHIIQWEH